MGTEYTARDLLYIVDAWDAWRHGAESPSNPQPGGSNPTSGSTRGKLVFWGFSYGSFLGTTFAALFPDRVGRLVLDGVVNAYENGNPFWQSSLRDTDKVLDRFFFECHEALSKCALYLPGDSIADIRERYDSAATTLSESPLWYIDSHYHQPNVFTLANFRKTVFAGLYYPLSSFVDIAELVNCIFERDIFRLAIIIGSDGGGNTCPNSCQAWMPPEYLPDDAGLACSCADKNEPVQCKLSVSFGEILANEIILFCR
jgi:pimeloyl-ACP methyl ester carboxylesterase